MKSLLTKTALILVLLLGVFSPVALGQRREGFDRGNDRRCRMEYNRAVREANRMRGPGRRIRLERARREYRDCMRTRRR
jgi:hypothetical protein